MSLFVLSSRDGWVNIMYTGLDAVGVDMQVCDMNKTKRAQNFIAKVRFWSFLKTISCFSL